MSDRGKGSRFFDSKVLPMVDGVPVVCRPIQCVKLKRDQVYISRRIDCGLFYHGKPEVPVDDFPLFSVSIAKEYNHGYFWKLKNAIRYAKHLQKEQSQ
jgi:hypothetical protein